ncbi:MAG: endonuclease III [Candidatus Thorarchaeota archaeon]
MDTKKKSQKVLTLLSKAYPDAPKTYLDYSNAFEMLIATILSARSTDAGVNKVTPVLFNKYPNPESLAEALVEDLAPIIRRVGAYNRKAAYIRDTSKMLLDLYGGEVPKTIDEMVVFPGVSRKTANVVLSTIYKINEGVVVDTHIGRVTQRLGLSQESKPPKIEKDLMKLLPQKDWGKYAQIMSAHGRRTCKSRKPLCGDCAVVALCPSAEL